MGWVHIVEFYDKGVKVTVEKDDNNLLQITRFPNPNTVQEIYLTLKGLATIVEEVIILVKEVEPR